MANDYGQHLRMRPKRLAGTRTLTMSKAILQRPSYTKARRQSPNWSSLKTPTTPRPQYIRLHLQPTQVRSNPKAVDLMMKSPWQTVMPATILSVEPLVVPQAVPRMIQASHRQKAKRATKRIGNNLAYRRVSWALVRPRFDIPH